MTPPSPQQPAAATPSGGPARAPHGESPAVATSDYVLAVQGLTKVFPGQRPLYNGVNLVVGEGEILVIVGESGIGKSVFLSLLVGLLDPSSGEIWYRPVLEGASATVDLPIHALPEQDMAQIRTEVGIVFQESSLFDWMTVYENIALPLEHHPEVVDRWLTQFRTVPGRLCSHLAAAVDFLGPRLAALFGLCRDGGDAAQAAACELMDKAPDTFRAEVIEASVLARMAEVRLDVVADRDKLPGELSGGMKTRVGIARTLSLRPRVLLYDEPTAGLDPMMAKGVAQAILDLQLREIVRTSIVVTHDKELYWILKHGAPTRLIYLYRGQFLDATGERVDDRLVLADRAGPPPIVHAPPVELPKGVSNDRRDPRRFLAEFTTEQWNPRGQGGP
ncbi:MAG: ATP-binding cassette domain-containing protein [Candidatus Riflebacteria bacterium]|nr:ATP-binding cassette domain-containing protein [Candidatus Riflebacteria bacterium]